MNRTVGAVMILASSLLVIAGGCGGDKEKTQDTAFKIPDSLLTPLESYNLTKDDYHPIDGGIMENPQIILRYPASAVARYVSMKIFDYTRSGFIKVSKEIGRPSEGKIVIIGTKDLDEYLFLTRNEWWYYGEVYGDTIYFEPFDILVKRGIAEISVCQKIGQMALSRISGGRVPMWMKEGIASYVAGEGEILDNQVEEFRRVYWDVDPSPETVESDLEGHYDRGRTRIAFFAAYRMVEKLLSFATMEDVRGFLKMLGSGSTLDEASNAAFGMEYNALLDKVRIDQQSGDGAEQS